MIDDDKRRLRNKLENQAAKREWESKRKMRGQGILEKINSVLKSSFAVSDLRYNEEPPFPAILTKRIEDSPGLVAPYISEIQATELLKCFEKCIGNKLDFQIWFDELRFVGIISCVKLEFSTLPSLARTLQDCIYIHPVQCGGVLVVYYYEQNWSSEDIDFSIIVQGRNFETHVQDCFAHCAFSTEAGH